MRMLIEMVCPDGHRNEYYVEKTTRSAICKACTKTATRVTSLPLVKFKGNGFPDNDNKWAKRHEYHGDSAKAKRGEELG